MYFQVFSSASFLGQDLTLRQEKSLKEIAPCNPAVDEAGFRSCILVLFVLERAQGLSWFIGF